MDKLLTKYFKKEPMKQNELSIVVDFLTTSCTLGEVHAIVMLYAYGDARYRDVVYNLLGL